MSHIELLERQGTRDEIERGKAELRALGAMFHQRGWCLGTSGNFSMVVSRDPLLVLVTASGKDKSMLGADDFVVVGEDGQPVGEASARPSAETLLHIAAARRAGAGAVLHTHSVWSTILSDRWIDRGHLEISGFEMLKGLKGITTHDTSVKLPVFENTQDIPAFAAELEERLSDSKQPMEHGYLIQKHGMHTWGADLAEARRHVEILEFLFEAVGRMELGGGR